METPYDEGRSGVRVENPLVAIALTGGLITLIVLLYNAGVWGPNPVNGRSHGTPGPVLGSFKTAEDVLSAAQHATMERDLPRAEAILFRGIEQYPTDQDLRVKYAETLVGLKKIPEAYEEYVAALAIGPRTHELEFAAGTMASMSGQPARAVEHFNAARTAQPNNPVYALYLAQVQRKQGDLDAAKANLLMVTTMRPDDATAWGTLADIALQENNLDLCLQHIEKARELQPASREWRLIAARAHKRKGDAERALIVLNGMDPAAKHEPVTVRLIAECYAMLERPADAGRVLAEASDATPGNADLAYEAATWYARAEETEKALTYARRAISLGHTGALKLVERLNK